jgi:hypothetical protein
MALCYGQKSDYQEAARLLGNGKGGPSSALAYFLAMSGRANEARGMLAILIGEEFPPTHIARVLAGLGEKEQAIEWLQKAVDQRDERVIMLKVDPHFDSLRSDWRFQNLLARIGLL